MFLFCSLSVIMSLFVWYEISSLYWTSVPQGSRMLILMWSSMCTWESLTLDGPLMEPPVPSTATRKDQTRTMVCNQQPAFHYNCLVWWICERMDNFIVVIYFICLQSLLSSIMESSPTTKTWRSFWQVKHFGIIYPSIHPNNPHMALFWPLLFWCVFTGE